jgi:hypothetical protein
VPGEKQSLLKDMGKNVKGENALLPPRTKFMHLLPD